MIYTTYYSNLKNIPNPNNTLVIAISDTTPIHMVLPKIKEFNRTKDLEAFKRSYLEMLEDVDIDDLRDKLSLEDDEDIVFVSYGQNPNSSHRAVLTQWLRDKLGLDVKELETP